MTRQDLRTVALLAAALVVVLVAMGWITSRMIAPDLTARDRPPPQISQPDSAGLPARDSIYMTDTAGLLSPQTREDIIGQLASLYARTGIEMTLLTLPDMAGYDTGGAMEPFATAIFNAWGIGDRDRNDGILILILRDNRQMRIELGAGFGPEDDETARDVITDAFLPDFRANRYEQGIETGIRDAIIAFGGYVPGTEDLDPVRRGWALIGNEVAGAGPAGFIAMIAGGIASLFGARRAWAARPRGCQSCGARMRRLSDSQETTHLSKGQRLEQELGTVHHDVWECTAFGCDTHLITSRPKGLRARPACPECGFRTLMTRSTTLKQATRYSSGQRRVDSTCQNCGHAFTKLKKIPRLREDDNGGSGSGGGRSSGGGASGSW